MLEHSCSVWSVTLWICISNSLAPTKWWQAQCCFKLSQKWRKLPNKYRISINNHFVTHAHTVTINTSTAGRWDGTGHDVSPLGAASIDLNRNASVSSCHSFLLPPCWLCSTFTKTHILTFCPLVSFFSILLGIFRNSGNKMVTSPQQSLKHGKQKCSTSINLSLVFITESHRGTACSSLYCRAWINTVSCMERWNAHKASDWSMIIETTAVFTVITSWMVGSIGTNFTENRCYKKQEEEGGKKSSSVVKSLHTITIVKTQWMKSNFFFFLVIFFSILKLKWREGK